MLHSTQRAFTLIEVTAVLVLVALLSTAAALSLKSAYRGSQMSDVIARVSAMDRTARRLSISQGTAGSIIIDQAEGSLRYKQASKTTDELLPVVLPADFEMTSVEVVGVAKHEQMVIPCSRQGRTPSYSLTLTGPGGSSRVLMVAGLTGQVLELETDASFEVDNLLSARPDTD